MNPADSLAALNHFIQDRQDVGPCEVTLARAVEHMLAFYAAVPADGCDEPNADQLLYQWGTYDWGHSEGFEIGITRQFMEPDEGELSFSQLRWVFRFEPTPELRSLGAGNHWCESREAMTRFGR